MSRAAQLLAANPRTAHLGKNIAMQQHAQRQAATTEAAKYKRTRADQLTDASTAHERQVGIKQLPMSPEQLQQQKDINQSKVSPKANWLGVPGIGAFNVSNREMISPYGNTGGQPGQNIPSSAGQSLPGSPLSVPPGVSGKGREDIIRDSIKAGRASMGELQKSVSTAQQMANQARTFKQLLSTQETGGFALNLPGAEKFSNIIGDKELPNMYAITNSLTPLMRQGMPGAASDRDVAMFRGATLDPSKPSEANNLIADGLIVAAQNKEGDLAFKTAYMKQYTTLDGADAAWNKYLNDNPIFEPDPATGKVGLNKKRASWNEYFSGNQSPETSVTQASGQEPSPGGNVAKQSNKRPDAMTDDELKNSLRERGLLP